jgi:hypothetical protein
MKAFCIAAVFISSVMHADGVGATSKMSTKLSANPIRKVVSMMQRMSAKIEAEGKEKEKMFEAFMCYCKGGDKNLVASISAAEEKVPQLESSIEGNKGAKAQLVSEVAKAKSDRAESNQALAKAKAIREKEASEFDGEVAEAKTNIAALSKAIPAIEQGSGAAFIQANTGVSERLRQLSVSMDMEAVDRDLLASFLADGSSARGSGEILGILKSMKEEMEKNLAGMDGEEKSAAKDYESLAAAKKKEKAALTKAIETKTVRIGELSVSDAQQKNDLEDTGSALAEDKAMFANLKTSCGTKQQEWEEYQKMQSTELVALAETIKLLNDDDALSLFKKTLPSASSFMQVQVTSRSMQRSALQLLKSARRRHRSADPRLDFLEMAMRGGQMGFDKIIKMVDDLMTVLKKEQAADDTKKAYCLAEFDKYEDIKKGLTVDISDAEKALSDSEENLEVLAKEIAELSAGIKDLDASVAEATSTRKTENTDYVRTLADNNAAKELLGMAKNRLNKFYNPASYKAAPKRELSEEERITVNMGGTLAPTAAPGGIAGTDITASSFVQVKSHTAHEQPAADMSFKSKGEQGGGVVRMLDILIDDTAKANQLLELEETNAQSGYEKFMVDAKRKRSLDAKALTDKESSKAATEAALEGHKATHKDKSTEMKETENFLMGMHKECDWLLKFHDTRKDARAAELDGLDKSRAVLSGADYSFLQTASTHLRGASRL